ncbi:P-loop ATPase, Sll1717 family [Prosthecomicrobium pneumaticum]|uniref:Orc1-like AAA ATPase domain-containing protein n=1 Tax=Prosthecomicrobium pneumaticum TaxID=81895 RepID=A0A7W9FQL1_9HYPH|nr:hypothetical protein [Prosthecomicrobium pneumaticum]MBB5754983.1 hypothetical protein [Prosthecomicrobium pneumaticum]
MPVFNDDTLNTLFGTAAAEDDSLDRFKEYFYYNSTYDSINSDLPIRILVGHKGVGKSALLRRSQIGNSEKNQLSVWIRPNDIQELRDNSIDQSFNSIIERWKVGLTRIIALKIISRFQKDTIKLNDYLPEDRAIKHVISFVHDYVKKLVPSLSKVDAAIVDVFEKEKKIYIYIDDIDRGWTASKPDIVAISALLNAMRDLSSEDPRLKFRIGLRSDVYFLVRTSDESTDKIEQNVVWLTWSNHEILCIVAKRILTFFGEERDQREISKLDQSSISRNILSKIMDPVFHGRGHWSDRPIHNVLLSLTRARPRDLIKLLHGAGRRAYKEHREIISSMDFESSFESYSVERLQDIVLEFKTEVPDVEKLLLAMKPTKIEKRTSMSYLFTMDQLSSKINKARNNVNVRFTNGRHVTTRVIIQFLYKIDFITARIEEGGVIKRRYFDQSRFLASEVADFGFNWEIHPAYRWALQPNDVETVIASLDTISSS